MDLAQNDVGRESGVAVRICQILMCRVDRVANTHSAPISQGAFPDELSLTTTVQISTGVYTRIKIE